VLVSWLVVQREFVFPYSRFGETYSLYLPESARRYCQQNRLWHYKETDYKHKLYRSTCLYLQDYNQGGDTKLLAYILHAHLSVKGFVINYLFLLLAYLLKCLGTTLKYQNCTHEEINSRLNSGNACYHSVHSLLSSRLLSRNVKIKIIQHFE
jgi:hypothetical protein